MAKYHRLLVAVDGSEPSLHALREAFKMASGWVTVVAVPPFYEGDLRLLGVPDAARAIREPCDTALARAGELAREAGAVIQPLCEVGVPHERIIAVAQRGSRDLIVMGAKGHGLLERVLVGSVTQRVIGFSPIDVLVVPASATLAWDRILVPIDGSSFSRAAAQGASVRGAVREGRAFQVIADLAREERIGLIIMSSHGRTGLARLLLGSVTERVIGHAPCPVLVVRAEK